ncbi:MAG: TonB-dependent siderophore receptor [Hyphomicrobiaceae bacterium]
MPPGTTLTTAGPVQGYRALSAMSSTKTATPIEQIPQSIQVVPKSLIEDQRPVSVDEALRNVSSVQATNALQTPAYESTLIRGFPAEQWLDGMPVYYNAGWRDALAHIERIEVLKGPSAILYGGGAGAPVGGAINVISKLPTDRAFGELGATFGSHNYFRPYFDINQPLSANGTALFRITGEFLSANSFIDTIESRNYAINPTLVLTDKERTTLTIQAHFSRWSQEEYQGLPAIGTVAGAFRIDRDLIIGPSSMPQSFSDVQGVTVTLDHKLNPYVDASMKVRASHQEFGELSQTIVGADGVQANAPFFGPSTWALSNVFLGQEQQELSVNPNVRFRFESGPIRNTILVGADYSRLTDRGLLTSDLLLGGVGLVDLQSPAFPFPYARPEDSLFTTFQKPSNRYVTQGAYSQWQASAFDRFHLLAGVRVSNIEIDYIDPAGGADFHTDKTKVLPRVGGVIDVLPGVSVYASYSEGLKANPFTFFVGQPEPEESKQKEAGIKLKLANSLSGTLAIFEIERSKVPVAVPGGFGSAAIGEQKSQGFEADVVWQPTRNWRLLAQYAHVDAELTRATPTAAAGNTLAAVPEDSGRVWVNYSFDPGILKGWSVGAGLYAASSSFVDLPNLYKTPGYLTVDARVAYESDRFTAALNVKNLTDETYWVPYSYFGGRVAPGPDRAVYGTLAIKY